MGLGLGSLGWGWGAAGGGSGHEAPAGRLVDAARRSQTGRKPAMHGDWIERRGKDLAVWPIWQSLMASLLEASTRGLLHMRGWEEED